MSHIGNNSVNSQNKITKYYLLCTVRMGQKAHIVDTLDMAQMNAIFTKKEIDLYLSKADGHYTAREIVIGGGGNRNPRLPVLVFM